jgi:hypothetical protein
MYTIIERKTELMDQYFPNYDENGNEIPGQGTTVTNTIVTTKVEYDIAGELVIVEIPHFNPQSEDDIELGINNRYVTEERKLSNQE